MTSNEITDLKDKTATIRAKLLDNSNVLQGIIENPSDLPYRLADRITESNNLIEFVNGMDAYFDEHAE